MEGYPMTLQFHCKTSMLEELALPGTRKHVQNAAALSTEMKAMP